MSVDKGKRRGIDFTINTPGLEKLDKVEAKALALADEVERLNAALASSADEARYWREEYEKIADARGFDELNEKVARFERNARRSLQEFKAFLVTVNLNDVVGSNDWEFEEYYERLEKGLATSSQAIIQVKQNYGRFIAEASNGPNGGMFDNQVVQQIIASLEELSVMVNTVLESVRALQDGGVKIAGSVNEVASISDILNQVDKSVSEMSEDAKGAYEPLTKLLEALTKYASLDDSKLISVSNALRGLGSLAGQGSFSNNSLKNIVSLVTQLQAVSQYGQINVKLDLSGVKVSKAAAENLQRVSEVKAKNLENLSKINFTNLADVKIKVSKAGVDNLVHLSEAKANNLKTIGSIDFSNLKDIDVNIDAETVDNVIKLADALKELNKVNAATVKKTKNSYQVDVNAKAVEESAEKEMRAQEEARQKEITAIWADYDKWINTTAEQAWKEYEAESKVVKETLNEEVQRYNEIATAREEMAEVSKKQAEDDKKASEEAAKAAEKRLQAEKKAAADAAKEAERLEKAKAKQIKDDLNAETQKQNAIKKSFNVEKSAINALQTMSAAQKGKSAEAYNAIKKQVEVLAELRQKLKDGEISTDEFKNGVAECDRKIAESTKTIKENGDAYKDLKGTLTGSLTKYIATVVSFDRAIRLAIRALRDMVKTAIEVDSSMTNLQIVTRSSDATMAQYGRTISDSAQKIGVSLTDLLDATTTFARLGYTLGESSTLAEYSGMLQRVGDIDTSAAQDAITSITKAFSSEIDIDNIESVMDRLIVAGNNFPISVSQISEGMTNAAAALSASGNSFNESVALLTAANTVVQNASKSSTALRTVAARLRNTTTELDELGETMNSAKYGQLVDALTRHNVALTDMNGEYRSTYEILKDIAAIWGDLTSMEQAGLATQIAGTRQQSVFYGIINNFQEATGVMDAMADSTGALDEAYSVYMDSMQAHINQLKAAWQAFSSDFVNSDVFNFGVSALKTIVSLLDKITSYTSGVGIIGLVTSVTLMMKVLKGTGLKTFISDLAVGKKQLSDFSTSVTGVGDNLKMFSHSFSAVALGVMAAISVIQAGITIYQNHMRKLREGWEEDVRKGENVAEEIRNIQDVYSVYDIAKSAYENGTGAKEAYDEATVNLIKSLGYEEDQIDNLITKYGGLTEAINTEIIAKNTAAQADLWDAVVGAEELVEDGLDRTIKFNSYAANALKDAGLNVETSLGNAYSYTLSLSENTREAAEQLEIARSALYEVYGEEVNTLDIWEKIDKQLDKNRDNIEKLKQADQAYAESLAFGSITEYINQFGSLPDSQAGFENLRDSMMEALEASDWFKNSMLDSGDVADAMLGRIPSLADYAAEHLKAAADEAKRIADVFGFGKMRDLMQQLNFERELSSNEAGAKIREWFDGLGLEDKKLVLEIAIENNSSAMWNLDTWIIEFEKAKGTVDDTSASLQEFYDVLKDEEEGSLSKAIESTQTKVDALLEIKDKLKDGINAADKFEIVTKFPELMPYINDVNDLDKAIDDVIKSSREGLDEIFEKQIEALGDDATESGRALRSFLDMLHAMWNEVPEEVVELRYPGAPNIENERQRYSDIQNAYQSGQSVGGMNSEEIEKIATAFSHLEGYNPAVLFERTTHGVQLNTIALRALNKEHEVATRSKYRDSLRELVLRYSELQRQLSLTRDEEKRSVLESEIQKTKELAKSVADEAAQYDGLTSSYKKWQEATSATDSRASWENMGKGLENVQTLVSSGWGNDNEVISFMNMFLEKGDEVTKWSELQDGQWEAVQNSISRYFDGTTGSLQTFLEDASAIDGKLFEIKQLADGSWDFNFEYGGEEELAKLLSDTYDVQMSAEAIQYILGALSDTSYFEVNIESDADQAEAEIADLETRVDHIKDTAKTDAILGIDSTAAKEVMADVEDEVAGFKDDASEETEVGLSKKTVEQVIAEAEEIVGRYKEFIEDPTELVVDNTQALNAIQTVEDLLNGLNDKTVKVNIERNVTTEANGTASADGTAFASGNWGTRKSGVALTGELGPELLIRDGKFFTIGDNGAEFIRYKKGDIIFNAAQTAELFKYGGTRGRGVSYAYGTNGGTKGRGSLDPTDPSSPNPTPSNPVDPGDLDEVTESAEEAAEAVEALSEVFDWIQVKIQRIEREITNLGRIADSTFKSWSDRNKALSNELEKVTQEIEIQQQGAERYRHEAESVGLDEEWAQKVRDGLIDIETLQSEATEASKEETQALIDKIKEYQKWYLIMPSRAEMCERILFNCWKTLRAILTTT